MAYVIHHPEWGIFLGSGMRVMLWSDIDPVGQPSAVTFRTEDDAIKFLTETNSYAIDVFDFIEVQADADGYATMQACVAAGLNAWRDEI